jgi:hypothetical protein
MERSEIRDRRPRIPLLHAGYSADKPNFSLAPQIFAAGDAVPMQRFRGPVI